MEEALLVDSSFIDNGEWTNALLSFLDTKFRSGYEISNKTKFFEFLESFPRRNWDHDSRFTPNSLSEGGGKISRDMKTLKLISVKRKILNIDCGWTVAAGEETAEAFCRRRRRSVDAITYK